MLVAAIVAVIVAMIADADANADANADADPGRPPWLDLRWPEVPGCPSAAAVEAAIVDLTAGGEPLPIRASAAITREGDALVLALTIEDRGGVQERVLRDRRCEALADAAALILAVAADPIAVADHVVPSAPPSDPEVRRSSTWEGPQEPEDEPADARMPIASPAAIDAPPVRSSRAPTLALHVGAAAGIGPSPRFTAGVSGGLALAWAPARLELRGSYWFPSPVLVAGRSDQGANLRLAAAAIRGCPHLVRRALALALCGGVELGALHAEGFGFADNSASRGLWAAGVLAPGVSIRPLRWLAIGLEVEGLIAFTRRAYVVRDAPANLYTVPAAGVRVGGGVALIFP